MTQFCAGLALPWVCWYMERGVVIAGELIGGAFVLLLLVLLVREALTRIVRGWW